MINSIIDCKDQIGEYQRLILTYEYQFYATISLEFKLLGERIATENGASHCISVYCIVMGMGGNWDSAFTLAWQRLEVDFARWPDDRRQGSRLPDRDTVETFALTVLHGRLQQAMVVLGAADGIS